MLNNKMRDYYNQAMIMVSREKPMQQDFYLAGEVDFLLVFVATERVDSSRTIESKKSDHSRLDCKAVAATGRLGAFIFCTGDGDNERAGSNLALRTD